jgi:mannose-6-phosphate isomerase-like protein (cupin superfamily)
LIASIQTAFLGVTGPAQAARTEGSEMIQPKVIDTTNAEHYTWGDGNDGWHLVKRDDVSVIHERMRPGAAEVPHYHRLARQFFQVLAGTLTMRVAGVDHDVAAGRGIEIAPGLPHQAVNKTAKPVEFVVVSTPQSHGDRVDLPDAK